MPSPLSSTRNSSKTMLRTLIMSRAYVMKWYIFSCESLLCDEVVHYITKLLDINLNSRLPNSRVSGWVQWFDASWDHDAYFSIMSPCAANSLVRYSPSKDLPFRLRLSKTTLAISCQGWYMSNANHRVNWCIPPFLIWLSLFEGLGT